MVWITKYAMTQGILTAVNAEVVGDLFADRNDPGKYITVNGPGLDLFVGKPDWHTSEAAALARVTEMIASARKSLAKKQAKLDKMAKQLVPGGFPTKALKQG